MIIKKTRKPRYRITEVVVMDKDGISPASRIKMDTRKLDNLGWTEESAHKWIKGIAGERSYYIAEDVLYLP